MKRLLLFTLSTIFTLSMSAQTVTFSDDFESYSLGDYVGEQSDVWETWSNSGEGTPEDALVTDQYAQSGVHSIEIRQTLLGTDADVDLMLPVVEFQGQWEVAFSLLAPSGFGGYWNIQGAAVWGTTWGFDMFIEPDGSYVVSQTVDAAATEYGSGTYTPDTWMDIVLSFDLDNDEATVSVDGVSSSAIPYAFIIGGMDFFGLGGATGDGLYFLDDVSITDMSPASISDAEAFDFEVYPSPASDVVNIISNAQGTAQVTLVNLAGQQVYTEAFNSLTQRQINVSDLAEGLYFVQITSGNEFVTKKILVKH
jgi:hypothetical protein